MKKTILMSAVLVFSLASCKQGNQQNSDSDEQFQMVIGAGNIGGAPVVEPTEVMKLYEGVAPGSETWTHPEGKTETNETTIYYNVSSPEMTVYLPDPSVATGAAMVVCPGGAFCLLSYTTEGTMVANELCKRGIAAIVLKYRTTPILNDKGEVTNDPEEMQKFVMALMSKSMTDPNLKATQNCLNMENSHLSFEDADRAISMVRQHAAKWGVNPDKIGIVGFSAGAVTSMHQVLEHSEAGKPNFGGIIYGGWTHDVKAPADAVPVFLCAPVNDIFYPEESYDVYMAWREAKLPVELHYYSDSQHGFGATPTGKSSDMWIDEMVHFMRDIEFVK